MPHLMLKAEVYRAAPGLKLAIDAGLPVRLHHLDVDAEERWRRVQRRNVERGPTYRLEVTREMFDFVETLWERPTDDELTSLNGARVGAVCANNRRWLGFKKATFDDGRR